MSIVDDKREDIVMSGVFLELTRVCKFDIPEASLFFYLAQKKIKGQVKKTLRGYELDIYVKKIVFESIADYLTDSKNLEEVFKPDGSLTSYAHSLFDGLSYSVLDGIDKGYYTESLIENTLQAIIGILSNIGYMVKTTSYEEARKNYKIAEDFFESTTKTQTKGSDTSEEESESYYNFGFWFGSFIFVFGVILLFEIIGNALAYC